MSAALKQASQVKIHMSVVKGPHAGQTFVFSKTELTFGRGPENDVILVNDPLVSRMHARIEFQNGEFNLINISQKNGLLVQGQYVDRWRLVNDSVFQIGDSEIKFEFDGLAVVSVTPPPPVRPTPNLAIAKPAEDSVKVQVAVPKQQAQAPATRAQVPASTPKEVAKRSSSVAAPQQPFNAGVKNPHPFAQVGIGQAANGQMNRAALEEEKNKKIRFFAIVAILILASVYFFMAPNKAKTKKAKPLLRYEDEIAFNQMSEEEAKLKKKRAEQKKAKDSAQVQRAEENFMKGMRDFQLGNYARAQDFFQVVLNLDPDHVLARRHLYLSKVRFDEIVQAKLMLGESYYQKHNFDMCQSMYQQVMDMLQGKSNDQKFKLAQQMIEKCQLASEGIN